MNTRVALCLSLCGLMLTASPVGAQKPRERAIPTAMPKIEAKTRSGWKNLAHATLARCYTAVSIASQPRRKL